MNALVELIKRIGIFMIAAQAVIHFTPGQKYEKYIRLIVGVMILLQFVMPLHSILNGAETDWNVRLADMEKLLEMESMTYETSSSSSVAESVISSLENEIKSKLNLEILGEDYRVSNVRIQMKVSEGDGKVPIGTRQYEIETVRVIVYRQSGSGDSQADGNTGNAENVIEKIQIEKIAIGGSMNNKGAAFDGQDKGNGPVMEGTEETAERLRERFCGILGMNEENMEVSVYGTNEKTDR